MAGYTCPFCNQIMSLNSSTYSHFQPAFSYSDTSTHRLSYRDTIQLNFYKCPDCNKISITLEGVGTDVKGIFLPVYPKSLAKQFPDYVPLQIRQDYEEAFAISTISPKASATLSRRCLQGMIKDFWGITKNNLAKAIEELETKVPYSQWKAIDAARKVGNIGAHMESDINLIVDIDPTEAHVLLMLIEVLIKDWYISQYENDQLYAQICEISEDKQNQRHPD